MLVWQALGDRLSGLEMGTASRSGHGDCENDGVSFLRATLVRGWRFNLLLAGLAAVVALQVVVLGIVSEIAAAR